MGNTSHNKNISIYMVPDSRQRENKIYMCESSTDILTPAQSYCWSHMNYSDSILPNWKEIHLASLKRNPLLQGAKKDRAAALPRMTPASPNPQITPTHGYKEHQFVITNNTACHSPHSEEHCPYQPLLFFRTPLSLLHQSEGGGIRCTFGLRK